MSDYGRNFEFRIPPQGAARGGRYVLGATVSLPIGVPVVIDTVAGSDGNGRQFVKLAAQGTLWTAEPDAGVLVYEYGPAAFAGNDPFLTTYSDKDTTPLGAAVQVVHGDPKTKVCLKNTVAHQFLGIRSYTGRVMVNGLGATPTVTVGDYLVPGAGDDVNGYWQTTATEAGAWAVITFVDTNRAEVEARMLF